jgi:hypothetical protein
MFVQRFRSKAVLLTMPAHETANILAQPSASPLIPEATELKRIPYPPMNGVVLSYPNTAFRVRHCSVFVTVIACQLLICVINAETIDWIWSFGA